jgi:PBP1b-binding outer membrane lipoprotein LpoB
VNPIKHLVLVVISALLLNGCSASVVIVGPTGPSANVEEIEVLYQEPDRKHQTIAIINHMAQTRLSSLDSVLYTCKKEAAKVGADALVVRNMKGAWTGMGGASVDARAVRWLE